MKVPHRLSLLPPVDVDEHRLHLLSEGGQILVGEVLGEPDPVEFLDGSDGFILGEIVDGDGVDVQLEFPLEQSLYLVGVAVLAALSEDYLFLAFL